MLPDEPLHQRQRRHQDRHRSLRPPAHEPAPARRLLVSAPVADVVTDVVTDAVVDPAPRRSRPRTRAPFERAASVPGFAGSRWGYDGVLECFWAELVAPDGDVVRIGPEHLLTTVPALARAVAHRGHVDPAQAYLALTA